MPSAESNRKTITAWRDIQDRKPGLIVTPQEEENVQIAYLQLIDDIVSATQKSKLEFPLDGLRVDRTLRNGGIISSTWLPFFTLYYAPTVPDHAGHLAMSAFLSERHGISEDLPTCFGAISLSLSGDGLLSKYITTNAVLPTNIRNKVAVVVEMAASHNPGFFHRDVYAELSQAHGRWFATLLDHAFKERMSSAGIVLFPRKPHLEPWLQNEFIDEEEVRRKITLAQLFRTHAFRLRQFATQAQMHGYSLDPLTFPAWLRSKELLKDYVVAYNVKRFLGRGNTRRGGRHSRATGTG